MKKVLQPSLDGSSADINILSSNMWSELRIFLAVSRQGSFAKAAESLGISTPTISRSVRRLQDMLGVQLVVPGIQGVALTSEGEALRTSLASIDLKIHSIETGFRRNSKRLTGVTRLGTMEGIGGIFIAPQLHQFHTRFPGITLSLTSDTRAESILSHGSDLVLAFEKTSRSNLIARPIGYMHLVPVASKSYIDKYGLPTKENIKDHQYLRYTNTNSISLSNPVWNDWNELMSEGSLAGEFDSRLTYAMATINGLGIALIGNYSLANHSLISLDLGVDIRLPIYLTALEERLEARHIRVTAEWLTRLFNSNQQWFGENPSVV